MAADQQGAGKPYSERDLQDRLDVGAAASPLARREDEAVVDAPLSELTGDGRSLDQLFASKTARDAAGPEEGSG